MKENLPEDVRKLAETLMKSGLVSSESAAVERAKASLKAQEIISKSQDKGNYFASEQEKTVDELLKDAAEKELKKEIEEASEENSIEDEEEKDSEEE